MSEPAFRRRILIEPSPGCIIAELEDDWHRMAVTVRHEDGVALSVEADMKRWPWTTCQGAIEQLTQTFTGQALSKFNRRGEKTRNCTHLHDLAVFAAAHALDEVQTTYDVTVTDPVDGISEARIARDDELAMAWTVRGSTLLAPAAIAGLTLQTLGDWISGLDTSDQEAARILRWSSILAFGRAMDIPEGLTGTAFPPGSCFTFQPAMAVKARRRADVPRDFSQTGIPPLADKSQMFRNTKETAS